MLLLRGMAAAGDFYGAAFDRVGGSARVVVTDLLGFGGSMVSTGPVSGDDHLDALDTMLTALGLNEQPLVVVGHSMGGPLALRFAARHSDRARSVITLCAALYRDRAEADARIALMGPFEAVISADGPLPRMLCAWMCRHRTAASWVAVGIRPDLPVPVARSTVKHTWDSYRRALNGLLRAPYWQPALIRLAAAAVPVVLVEGSDDPVPVPGRAAAYADPTTRVRYLQRRKATHLLPLTEGEWCATVIAEYLDATQPRSQQGPAVHLGSTDAEGLRNVRKSHQRAVAVPSAGMLNTPSMANTRC